MLSRFSTSFRRAGSLCLLAAVLALANVARADDIPTFSNPDVTAFVKSYGTFTDQYSAIMKDYMAAMKSNDTAKMQESAKKMQDISTKSAEMQTQASTVGSKVKPEEATKFSDYLQKCAQKMAEAAKQ